MQQATLYRLLLNMLPRYISAIYTFLVQSINVLQMLLTK